MIKIAILAVIFTVLAGLFYAVSLPSKLTSIEQIGRNLLRVADQSTSEAEIKSSTSGIPNLSSQISPKQSLRPSPTPDWTVRKVDEHQTEFSVPISESMSTISELFEAVNSYRRAHGLNTLTSNTTICDIAQKRAEEQVVNGGLDNHAGFNKYGESQTEFSHLGEVLYGGQPLSGVHIVEFGWDRSLTGHREALQNPSWQIGCGGIAGVYAAFIFANN